MRAFLFALSLAVSGAAVADDLADARTALAAKSYPQAMQLFSKLADAGNAEARFRLAEMLWYGQGVAPDRARADALFAQAAAAGIAEARTALTLSSRRAQRSDEIARWTGSYDGTDLTAGQYRCERPAIPAMSKTNADIVATNAAFNAWTVCHNGMIANLADAMPAGKRVPAETVDVMSEAELDLARVHLDRVYGNVADRAQAEAGEVVAQHGAWERATVAFVADANKQASVRRDMEKQQLELRMHQIAGRPAEPTRRPEPPPPPPPRPGRDG